MLIAGKSIKKSLTKKYILIPAFLIVLALLAVKFTSDGEPLGSRTSSLQVGNNINSASANSVLFVDSSLQLAEDNTNFVWNDTNDDLLVAKTVVGATTASASVYTAEFSSAATTSLLFGTTATNRGTCIQLRNTAGTWVFLRIIGTVVTVNTISCR